MTKLSRILKDYRDSGALHAKVGIHAALDNQTFLCKSGDLVAFLALRGLDSECLDPGQLDQVTRQFESAIRGFEEKFRVMQYLVKQARETFPHGHYAGRLSNKRSGTAPTIRKARRKSSIPLNRSLRSSMRVGGMRRTPQRAFPR
jgi:type IV secretory pathway VirB4 component